MGDGQAEAVVDARLQQAVMTAMGQVQTGLGEVRAEVRAVDGKLDTHTEQDQRNFDLLHASLREIAKTGQSNAVQLASLATAAQLAREQGREGGAEAGGLEGRRHGRRAMYGATGITAGLLALAEILRSVGVIGGG